MRERRTKDAEENQEDGRRRQTHEKGGETHIVLSALLEPSLPSRVEREVTLNTPSGIVVTVAPFL